MSKEHHISQVEKKVKQPEVGDVWENNNTKKQYMYWVSIKRLGANMSVGVLIGKRNQNLLTKTQVKNFFLQNYAYLGKSKVKLKELFDVSIQRVSNIVLQNWIFNNSLCTRTNSNMFDYAVLLVQVFEKIYLGNCWMTLLGILMINCVENK